MHSSRIYLNKGPAQLPRAELAGGAVGAGGAVIDQQGMNVDGRVVLQGDNGGNWMGHESD